MADKKRDPDTCCPLFGKHVVGILTLKFFAKLLHFFLSCNFLKKKIVKYRVSYSISEKDIF